MANEVESVGIRVMDNRRIREWDHRQFSIMLPVIRCTHFCFRPQVVVSYHLIHLVTIRLESFAQVETAKSHDRDVETAGTHPHDAQIPHIALIAVWMILSWGPVKKEGCLQEVFFQGMLPRLRQKSSESHHSTIVSR